MIWFQPVYSELYKQKPDFRKQPDLETLKNQIALISATKLKTGFLVNEKSQDSKIPWPISFRSSGAI